MESKVAWGCMVVEETLILEAVLLEVVRGTTLEAAEEGPIALSSLKGVRFVDRKRPTTSGSTGIGVRVRGGLASR